MATRVAPRLIPDALVTDRALPDGPAPAASGRRGRLALALHEPLEFAARLRAGRDAGTDAAALRRDVLLALRNGERAALRAGYGRGDVRSALYAVIVLLDEVVLHARPLFDQWARRPLQEELFGENTGGEGFFEALDQLLDRTDRADVADVLEVYQLCLALGFRGRHVSRQGELYAIAETLEQRIAWLRQQDEAAAPAWALPADDAPPAADDPIARRLTRIALVTAGLVLTLFLLCVVLLQARADDGWSDLRRQLGLTAPRVETTP
ncbi:MAG: DotU family type IV/VI secretion system protein [Gemmatimonadaceae bacterium]|jgi:type VI secretion system protein ImpK|nr:DotU family type IV/VI secretion system protein [Gemmatimonadaceae bacterium]